MFSLIWNFGVGVWTLVTAVYGLWAIFLAVMNLKRARDAELLGPVAYAMGVPLLALGYVLDAIVNWTVFSLAFAEVPHEMTVTYRLKRHIADPGWRGRLARWLAAHLLDPFDPDGRHV